MTPQNSDELKEKFTKTKDDLADRAADYYDYAKDATAEWRESAQGVVSDLKEKAAAKADDGDVASYDDATQALKDQLTDAPETANSDAFDDIVLDARALLPRPRMKQRRRTTTALKTPMTRMPMRIWQQPVLLMQPRPTTRIRRCQPRTTSRKPNRSVR
ncbi:YtxH domain-containing protein [Lacticaseibacillus camelliae]|uniref:YtxH domain-containing protein n=1 Tax=Lacticaseibacillus camelliae TaxID=381742 RepID=UPI000A603EC9|nr:YtxH domain-containing protein [Lacticaseibacillus camelliae]